MEDGRLKIEAGYGFATKAIHAGQAPDIDSVCVLQKRASAGIFVRGTISGFDGYDLLIDN